ncbi:nuclear transport factor 2 family protein [Pseudonocardia spinosispora]|uniref:nuclear transport factor 2 family protein n=1 Tax=Pseudonocardia spinosispora TaxID=103441 RepID=UPI000423274B|nr:nuclear transport factor 2 family protein [Pseudonocardia spinosispora]
MDPVRLLQEYAQVKNAHDVEGMLARTHPECRYEEIGTGRIVEGHDELRRSHLGLFAAMPGYTATPEGVAASGEDTAVLWGRFAGVLAQPLFGRGDVGDRIDTAAVFVCTFRDGLLYREQAHIDLVSLHRQLRSPAARFAEAFTAAWNAPSGERLSALFTEDATVRHPGMAEPVVGRDAIRRYFDGVVTALPDIRLRPLAVSADGDTVFVHWRITATLDGADTAWEGIDRFDLGGELADKGVAHFDPATVRPLAVTS